MPTNRELEVLTEKLQAEIEEYKNEVTQLRAEVSGRNHVPRNKEMTLSELAQEVPTDQEPTDYEKAEAAHRERVQPYIDAWEKKKAEYIAERTAEFQDAGQPINKTTQAKIETEADKLVKYEGPVRDYHKYLMSERIKADECAVKEGKAQNREGCPDGYQRGPDGLMRSIKTGELWFERTENKGLFDPSNQHRPDSNVGADWFEVADEIAQGG